MEQPFLSWLRRRKTASLVRSAGENAETASPGSIRLGTSLVVRSQANGTLKLRRLGKAQDSTYQPFPNSGPKAGAASTGIDEIDSIWTFGERDRLMS